MARKRAGVPTQRTLNFTSRVGATAMGASSGRGASTFTVKGRAGGPSLKTKHGGSIKGSPKV
jgi:hypothetical protein